MVFCDPCAQLWNIKSESAEDAGLVICEICARRRESKSAYIYVPDIISRLQGKIPYNGSRLKLFTFKILKWILC